MNHPAYFDRFTLTLPAQAIEDCAQSGDVSAPVADWATDPEISAQFDAIAPADIAEELRGYGAWDDEEITDDAANRKRVLWIAAGNIRDEMLPLQATASDWHSGQNSALYAFSSSGTIIPGLASEVRECIREANSADDIEELEALLAYAEGFEMA
jgi:hypothetical protein